MHDDFMGKWSVCFSLSTPSCHLKSFGSVVEVSYPRLPYKHFGVGLPVVSCGIVAAGVAT